MAASTQAYTFAEFKRWLGRQTGKGRTPGSDWTAIDTTDGEDIIKAAYHRITTPPVLPNENVVHVWSFLSPTLAQLELHAAYATGTISSSSTTVTLTGGTWPSWAAQGELWADGFWHTVASRSSNSVIVLDVAPSTAFSSDTFSLQHREYDLPDDFGGIDEPFSYRKDQYAPWNTLIPVNEAMIRGMSSYPEVADWPAYSAIVSVAPTSAQESKRRATFYPATNATRTLWYRYKVEPPSLDGSTYVYPYGDAQFADLMRISVLNESLKILYDDNSKEGEFMQSLRSAILMDRRMNRPLTLGFGSFSDGGDRGYGLDIREIHRNTSLGTIDLI